MSGIEFNIREFDISKIGDNKIIVFIGKRNTGKSILLLDYLYNNQDIPMGTCVSPTAEFNHAFTGKIPDIFIHDDYTPELIEKFVTRQKNITKKQKENPKYKNIDPRAFLIFDDCLHDAKDWIKDTNIKFIFFNGRHVGITFLLTMQYALGIPPGFRTNVDYIFICKETKITIKKKLYDYYAGMFPSFDMFSQVLDEITKDYGCMVIDNTTQSARLEDQVFWYKADISRLKNFKLCDDIFWNTPAKTQIYDENEDVDRAQNVTRYVPKRNKINYNVHRLQQGENKKDYYDPKFQYRY